MGTLGNQRGGQVGKDLQLQATEDVSSEDYFAISQLGCIPQLGPHSSTFYTKSMYVCMYGEVCLGGLFLSIPNPSIPYSMVYPPTSFNKVPLFPPPPPPSKICSIMYCIAHVSFFIFYILYLFYLLLLFGFSILILS